MLPMKEFKTAKEVLDFALKMEELSIKFYLDLAKACTSRRMEPIYYELANSEKGHKQKLDAINIADFCFDLEDKVSEIHLADYSNPQVNYESLKLTELLVIAINRERRSYMLYEKLAYVMSDSKLKKVFQYLAKEESLHKLKFEMEYDDFVFAEH